MAKQDELRTLLDLYIAKRLDAAQKQRLADLLQDPANEGLLEAAMRESFFEQGVFTEASDGTVDKMMAALRPRLSLQPATGRLPVMIRMTRWVAASVLLIAAGAIYFLTNQGKPQPENRPVAGSYRHDIPPARKGAAILKLANGQEIRLDSVAPGLVARQGHIEIIKEKDGQLRYQGMDGGELIYNEIMTIKGQELTVTLPDNSVATLNAASSLRYPLTFRNGERLVAMTGEVHFKVMHDEKNPFRVQAKGQLIEDLGTEFNINTYDDEPVMRTTLVQGAVSIRHGKTKAILKPGEEALSVPGNDAIKVSTADLDLNLAWYKGEFSYKHAGIPTVMREFARWYNVTVAYENNRAPDATFTGEMGRDLTLTQALDGLKTIGIHYRLDGDRRLTILQQ